MNILDNVDSRLPTIAACGAMADLLRASPPLPQPAQAQGQGRVGAGEPPPRSAGRGIALEAIVVDHTPGRYDGYAPDQQRERKQVLLTAASRARSVAEAERSAALVMVVDVAGLLNDHIADMRCVYAAYPYSPFATQVLLRPLLLAGDVVAFADDLLSPVVERRSLQASTATAVQPTAHSMAQPMAPAIAAKLPFAARPQRLWRLAANGHGLCRWTTAPAFSAFELAQAEAALVDVADRRLASSTTRGGRSPAPPRGGVGTANGNGGADGVNPVQGRLFAEGIEVTW